MGDVLVLLGATLFSCCLAICAWCCADRFAHWVEGKWRARSK